MCGCCSAGERECPRPPCRAPRRAPLHPGDGGGGVCGYSRLPLPPIPHLPSLLPSSLPVPPPLPPRCQRRHHLQAAVQRVLPPAAGGPRGRATGGPRVRAMTSCTWGSWARAPSVASSRRRRRPSARSR